MRMTSGDDAYKRNFDRACAQLVRLERKRGKIAHGIAAETENGAMFFVVPEALAALYDKPEEQLMESMFSFAELEQLEADITKAAAKNATLGLEALQFWKQGSHSTRAQ